MIRLLLSLGLIYGPLFCSECFAQTADKTSSSTISDGISPDERHALVALYEATDGNQWKDHSSWLGLPGTECKWYGVECAPGNQGPSTIVSLDLSQNELRGSIPETLGELTHLEWLTLWGNHLSGILPVALTRRWLSGSLSIGAEAPLFTTVSEIDFEFDPSSLLCGRRRIVLRSDGTAIQYEKRCRSATPRDRTTFCEVRQGRILGPFFAKVAYSLEENDFFSLEKNYSRNITDSAFASTRVTKDGKKFEVVNYADGGPFRLWAIQAIIEGAESDEWEKTTTQPECPRWDKSRVLEKK